LATNALITRRLPHVAMVTTSGFRDVIEIGRSTKQDLWDAYQDNPPPYIRRRDRLTFRERTSALGQVEIGIDAAAARELAVSCANADMSRIAVCFMNSFANPANEREMKRILEQELPRRRHLELGRRAMRDVRARPLLDGRRQRRTASGDRRLFAASAGAPARRRL
jgi:N-methylhydantoinase A